MNGVASCGRGRANKGDLGVLGEAPSVRLSEALFVWGEDIRTAPLAPRVRWENAALFREMATSPRAESSCCGRERGAWPLGSIPQSPRGQARTLSLLQGPGVS